MAGGVGSNNGPSNYGETFSPMNILFYSMKFGKHGLVDDGVPFVWPRRV